MLIGGSSGSTAGGVKTGTFGIVIYAAFCIAAGRNDVVLFRRKIQLQDILRAVSLIVICILLVFSFAVIILQIEQSLFENDNSKVNFVSIFFETASAFSTCGLTMGITSSLSGASHILLMILMFLGRIGIFTVTVTAFAKSTEDASSVKFPTTKMLIG
jgi:Trk-type K+ transport system membrane component